MATVPHPAPHRRLTDSGLTDSGLPGRDPSSPAGPRRRPAGLRALAATLAAATALLLAGCDLRWETTEAADPVADAAELVRAQAVDDALALQTAATTATTGADAATAAVLSTVATTAATQVTALGGVYDPGTADATPTATATSTAASTPAEVLALLATATATARTGAIDVEDGGLARALAAVAASRAQLGVQLAAALGVEAPTVDTTTSTDASATDGATGTASTASGTTASASTGSTASGLTRTVLLELVAAEDQAGYGFEVAAARLADADRETATAQAAAHRAVATGWAEQAGVAGTADDPRRVTYAVDADLSSTEAVRAFCGTMQSTLVSAYGDAVLSSSAGSTDRVATVDALREAAVAALGWGVAPSALPGVPDSTATTSPTATATTAAG